MMDERTHIDKNLTSLRPENLSLRTLYKFRAWDLVVDPHGQDILKRNILWLSSARYFNDPQEGRTPLRYDLASSSYLFELMLAHAPLEYPELSADEVASLSKTYIEQEAYKEPEEIQRQFDDHHKILLENYGISSLTDDVESVVLWSHYANSHKGYCVGLDLKSILAHRHKLVKSSISLDLYRVHYHTRMPRLIPSELSTEEMIIWPLTTKSNEWMYEKEFRLISLAGPGEMEIPNEYISQVILGYDMPPTHRTEVIDTLSSKSHHIPLFEVTLASKSFNIQIREIDY